MNKIGILLLFVAIQTQQASAQEKTKAEKSDSIEAVLPQLSDTVKLRAIKELVDLTIVYLKRFCIFAGEKCVFTQKYAVQWK